MGLIQVAVRILHHVHRKRVVEVPSTMVDSGSEFSWIDSRLLRQIGVTIERRDQAFVLANGQLVTRDIGFAIVQVREYFTIDEVVFGREGDQNLLGARTMEGLGFIVDLQNGRLLVARSRMAARGQMKSGRRAKIKKVAAAQFAEMGVIAGVPAILNVHRAEDPETGKAAEVISARSPRRRSKA